MESRTLQLLEFPKILSALADFAASGPGKSACLGIRPYSDPLALADRARFVAEGLAWAAETGFSLTDFPSLEGLFSFASSAGAAPLDLDDLFAVFTVLSLVRDLRQGLAESGERYPVLGAWAAQARWPERCWSGLKRCLSADARLRDESSPELFSVRQEIRAIHQRCARKARDFVQAENIAQYLQDEFLTISNDRYVLPIKTNFKGRVRGIVHDYSQTGETCYVEPYFLVDVNNDLQDLKRQEREEELKVLTYLTSLVREEIDLVRRLNDLLVEVDVLLALRGFAAAVDGRLVDVSAGRPLSLRRARHPLLALQNARQNGRVIPLDIELEESQRILVISGGNAGGKTVCLKTLGLTALLALSAVPAPVDQGSALPFLGKIFVFIGDEQSLEERLSTFTGQIQYLSRVWSQVDDSSLVILDEFGAGTDPTQGAALAQAVIDALLDQRAFAAAATHFPALKAYGLSKDGVRAASVLFDPASKKPLYRLAYDQVGASLALDVAREHGLPAAILERAEQHLLLEGSDTSKVLDRLNALAANREAELDDLRREKLDWQRQRAKLDERFARERDRLVKEVRAFSQDVMRQWREEKIGRKEALRALAEQRAKLVAEAPVEAAPPPPPAGIKVGDRVVYRPWSREAHVQDKDDRRGMFKVDMGGVSLWVKPVDLAPLGAPLQAGKAGGATVNAASPVSESALRLDLRGLRADEALSRLEKFIDQALLRGMQQVEIVHGKGTGALKRETHAYLKGSPAVAGFALAPADRGGDGVTVADLR